jgi:hypothetical protein
MEYSQYGRDEVVTLTAKHFEDLIRDNERLNHVIRDYREQLGSVKQILQSEYEQNREYVVKYGIGYEVAQAIGWEPQEPEEEENCTENED